MRSSWVCDDSRRQPQTRVTGGPTISVVIPTRNGERYIGSAIASVLAQTYPLFRLFILESGSTDHTLDIIQSFEDPRVVVLSEPQSLGIEQNWARMLSLDLDEYVTIVGHDDLLYPNFLAEIVKLIAAEPEASLYHTHFDLINDQGQIIRSCQPIPYKEGADSYLLNVHHSRRDSFATGYVMRTDDFRQVGGFPSFSHLMYADHMTWYRLAALSCIVSSSAHTFAFRMHEASTSSLADPVTLYHAATDYLKALHETGHFGSPKNLKAAKRYVERYFNGQFHRYLAHLIEEDSPAARQRYLEMKANIGAQHAQEPLFTVYDMPSRFYEYVAFRTRSYPRELLSRLIKTVRRIREQRRQQLYRDST